MNILEKIVVSKKLEVKELYKKFDIESLKRDVSKNVKINKSKFIIAEFKRQSPSAGKINESVSISEQINGYVEHGYNAVSVLTDKPFFGGDYNDLQEAAEILNRFPLLLLNKEFIIDPIQVYLARKFGANFILLIAAILTTEEFEALKNLAESLGMGVLAEIHNEEEYRKIETLGCPVIGINNRDLTQFKTSINNTNYLVEKLELHNKFIIAESGISSLIDIKILAAKADGFLVGTSLMQQTKLSFSDKQNLLFKACGIRNVKHFNTSADLLGFNFSLVSKRRVSESILKELSQKTLNKSVVVFYKNNAENILETLKKYPFKYVQLYLEDCSLPFIKSLNQKIILAIKVNEYTDWELIENYIPYTDLLILDGDLPGSGNTIADNLIPQNFPYPFLLAGGINEDNLHLALQHKNCIGVDIASGIETDGEVDALKIKKISEIIGPPSRINKTPRKRRDN
ncbi:UNVERIFIED_CONTAM: hypothetical protein GTU68_043698 [Idotea baltica]|nr:hypothetical protein [Idotea baltica]